MPSRLSRCCQFDRSKGQSLTVNSLVLEIGVYVGFSALVWADAVGPNGLVTGLEYESEYAELPKKAFAANSVNNVEIIVGPASES